MRTLVVLALVACGDNASELDVTIDSGSLHGAETDGVRHWFGIPYAAPPVGDLRWRAPQLPPRWSGLRDGRQIGSQCPQSFSFTGAGGDEDCLFLNVFSPSGAHGLPVMLWIHGGAFVFGSGGEKYYAGDHLVSTYGMVIVTINYRLGALGYLAHPALDTEDPAYPTSGNYGLEDQRAALEWVQRNIAAFGGDPKQVTVFGESAGGFSACALYLSPRTHGLFGAAISESGLCSGQILEQPHAVAEAQGVMAGAALGCPGSDAGALACLRGISSDQILNVTGYPLPAMQMPGGAFYDTDFVLPALPNIDGFVLPMSTQDAFATGAFEARPLLLGTNRDEGTLLQSTLFAAQIDDDTQYHDALSRRFGAAAADQILARYPSSAFPSPNRAIAEVSGDAFFVCAARRTARGAKSHGAPTYRYTFTHQIDNPFESGLGIFHSSEIPFVFGEDVFLLDSVGADGAPVAAAMESYWTTFAKTGTPKADAAVWPAYDPTTDAHLVLGDPIAPGTQLKSELCDFWDTIQPLLSG